MKLPIWAFNKTTGKYEVFPLHLLDTLSNGSKGLAFRSDRDSYSRVALFNKYREYFYLNPLNHNTDSAHSAWEYSLKDQE